MTINLLIKRKFKQGFLEKWGVQGHKALASDLLNTHLHIWATSNQKATKGTSLLVTSKTGVIQEVQDFSGRLVSLWRGGLICSTF